MDGLQASEKLKQLDERIEALNEAYKVLWDDFDKRIYAISLNSIQAELEQERNSLLEKLRSITI